MLTLVSWYGPNGMRYEDSRVLNMMQDTADPQPDTFNKFLNLLKLADSSYSEDVLGESLLEPLASSSQSNVHRRTPSQTTQKVKHHKLMANWFLDVTAVEDDEEEAEEKVEEPIYRPEPSGKRTYQEAINAIINRLNHRTPEQAACVDPPETLQLPEGIVPPLQKSIFIVDFFSGTFYEFVFMVLLPYNIIIQSVPGHFL